MPAVGCIVVGATRNWFSRRIPHPERLDPTLHCRFSTDPFVTRPVSDGGSVSNPSALFCPLFSTRPLFHPPMNESITPILTNRLQTFAFASLSRHYSTIPAQSPQNIKFLPLPRRSAPDDFP
ncbi:hypothetical protein HGRIS_011775 [Hohenbuehelia grisea]|uniref:Uncharacterized protein n=1 Tax=Hohenbuehelia grisea TaxID=104357 RepID=A0ABR3JW55_9AGAR